MGHTPTTAITPSSSLFLWKSNHCSLHKHRKPLRRAHCRVPNRSKHLLLLKRGNEQVGCAPPRVRWMVVPGRTLSNRLASSIRCRNPPSEEALRSDFPRDRSPNGSTGATSRFGNLLFLSCGTLRIGRRGLYMPRPRVTYYRKWPSDALHGTALIIYWLNFSFP